MVALVIIILIFIFRSSTFGIIYQASLLTPQGGLYFTSLAEYNPQQARRAVQLAVRSLKVTSNKT